MLLNILSTQNENIWQDLRGIYNTKYLLHKSKRELLYPNSLISLILETNHMLLTKIFNHTTCMTTP